MIYGYFMGNNSEQIQRIKKEFAFFADMHHLNYQELLIDFSVKSFSERNAYETLKNKLLHAGSTLLITELAQLGKNKKEILEELKIFRKKNIRLIVMDLPATCPDTSKYDKTTASLICSAVADTMIDLYTSMVFTEIDLMRKKQLEGIERRKRKNNGVYGRPQVDKPENWQKLLEELNAGSISSKEAIARSGLKKTTFYKLLKEEKQNSENLSDNHK